MKEYVTPPPKNLESSRHRFVKSKKRFSIRTRMVLIFGALVIAGLMLLTFIAERIARKALHQQVEERFLDKANDVTEILQWKFTSVLEFMNGISHISILYDTEVLMKKRLCTSKKL